MKEQEIRESFEKKFPSLSVVEGIGEGGSLHGYNPTQAIADFFLNLRREELNKLKEEVEKMPADVIGGGQSDLLERDKVLSLINTNYLK